MRRWPPATMARYGCLGCPLLIRQGLRLDQVSMTLVLGRLQKKSMRR